ncbi:MLO-like protein 13 [Cocos nucifera]|uniref:MLO-like protein n=1 Tax=Cocos nucifera TaxID=13894 RepID=A0A8K0HVW7_COCNU|nr:MLO-like protein 13 [Cocos nucifera]
MVASSSSEPAETLEYTATWVVAAVCTVIVIISLLAERFLHYLGDFLKHNQQDALFEALQKLKEGTSPDKTAIYIILDEQHELYEPISFPWNSHRWLIHVSFVGVHMCPPQFGVIGELMLLGFISLLLTVFENTIRQICIPTSISMHMLPCKKEGLAPEHELHHGKVLSHGLTRHSRRLLSESSDSEFCKKKGKVPLLSLEALHQLHIFIFVLAVVHVVFCATTMVLGGAKMSFIKQFYASVTKSDYRALRSGFIMRHCSSNPNFDFHKYMMRTLEDDFKIVVGISWYLWLFVIVFLLLNVNGWHAYFWLSFLPLIVNFNHVKSTILINDVGNFSFFWLWVQSSSTLLLVWLKRLQRSLLRSRKHQESSHLITISGFVGLASSFTYSISSYFRIPLRLRSSSGSGVTVQVLCSYSTLPLYAIVTQMGDMFKKAIFDEQLRLTLHGWAEGARKRKRPGISSYLNKFGSKSKRQDKSGNEVQMQKRASDASARIQNALPADPEGIVESVAEHSETQAV